MSSQSKPVNLKFSAGLHRNSTRYGEEGAWYDCDRVRWRQGLPEAMRGRTRYSSGTLEGTARAILSWTQLDGNTNVAVGTECFLYLNQGGTNYDITPIRAITTLTSLVNTSIGSTSVVVCATGHGLTSGDHVLFTSATTVGGNVDLSNKIYATSVITADGFAITYASAANSTQTNGGVVTANYYVACGLSATRAGIGWGTGTWGTGTWGTPRTGGASVLLYVRQWSFDKWGEDLIANIKGGGVYVWDATNGPSTRATLITAAPSVVDHVIVTEEERHLMVFGCTDTNGTYDSLCVRWSDSENYNVWTPSATNKAGELRIVSGSRIVGATRSKGQILVLTDNSAHAVRFVGGDFVFGIFDLGDNCGLIGKHAVIDANGRAFWMSTNNFYMYDGALRAMICPLQRDLFGDLNLMQRDKIYAGTNSEFNEIVWLYCSSTSDEIDRYVIYNYEENAWYWGSLSITAIEDSPVLGNVIGAGVDTYIFNMEPVSVYADDGVGYESFVESADFDVSDGHDIMFADRLIPDFRLSENAVITLQLQGKYYPNDTSYTVRGPYNVSASTRYVRTRLRARQMNLRIACSVSGASWSEGTVRLDIMPNGLR